MRRFLKQLQLPAAGAAATAAVDTLLISRCIATGRFPNVAVGQPVTVSPNTQPLAVACAAQPAISGLRAPPKVHMWGQRWPCCSPAASSFPAPGLRHIHSSAASRSATLEEVASDLAASTAQLESLEARLVELEGVEGMRATLHGLALALDSWGAAPPDMQEKAVAELFTSSATLDAGEAGTAEGLDELAAMFTRLSQGLSFAKHFVCNVAARVSKEDHSSGKATYYQLVAATVQGQAVWGFEVVDVRMRRGFDARWRISQLKSRPGTVLTPYSGPGWAELPNIMAQLLQKSNNAQGTAVSGKSQEK